MLCVLARTPGSLVTKNALLDHVWSHRFVSDSVLKTAITQVRAALDDDPRKPRYIETVSRDGYRFIAAGVSSQMQARLPNSAAALLHRAIPHWRRSLRYAAATRALADLILGAAATLQHERLGSGLAIEGAA